MGLSTIRSIHYQWQRSITIIGYLLIENSHTIFHSHHNPNTPGAYWIKTHAMVSPMTTPLLHFQRPTTCDSERCPKTLARSCLHGRLVQLPVTTWHGWHDCVTWHGQPMSFCGFDDLYILRVTSLGSETLFRLEIHIHIDLHSTQTIHFIAE